MREMTTSATRQRRSGPYTESCGIVGSDLRRFLTPFSYHKQTRMRVYFAHPHSPWERGTNDNTNDLLRQFLPKGTRFNQLSRKEINQVKTMVNDRPRKVITWHSPAHAFHQLLR